MKPWTIPNSAGEPSPRDSVSAIITTPRTTMIADSSVVAAVT